MNGATAIDQDDSIARVSADRYHINWITNLPFLGMHVACLGAFWVRLSWKAAALCAALYAIRMFGITAGYHRYFSHRSYRTSRALQFALAWIGCSALQKGPLWWAALHRHHHRHRDRQGDRNTSDRAALNFVGWTVTGRFLECCWLPPAFSSWDGPAWSGDFLSAPYCCITEPL